MPRLALRLALVGAVLSPVACTADTQGAQGVQGVQGVMQACATEHRELCGAVAPGGGRIVQCLREHAAQTSPACGQALQATPEAMAPPAEGMPPIPPANPSPASADALTPNRTIPEPTGQRGAIRVVLQTCAAEHRQFCADVAPGGGRIVRCLRQHVARAAPACGQALQALPLAMAQPRGAPASGAPPGMSPATAPVGTGGQLGANLPSYGPAR